MCMPWASSDNLTPHSPPLQVCEQHVPSDDWPMYVYRRVGTTVRT